MSEIRLKGPQTPTEKEVHLISEAVDELNMTGEEELSAKLLLTMASCGTTNPDKLAKAANLNRDFCRLRCKRLRDNGVITAPRTLQVEWFDDDPKIGHVALILDILVAEGRVTRTTTDDDLSYSPADDD